MSVMDVNNVAYIFYANHSTTIVMIVMAVWVFPAYYKRYKTGAYIKWSERE